MQSFQTLITENLLVAAIVAVVLLLISISPLLRRTKDTAKEDARREKAIRQSTLEKLRASNSFQTLEMSEKDALTVLDIVRRDNVKLEGKYKRAAQHIQKVASAEFGALLSEDQITAVLVAYRQSL